MSAAPDRARLVIDRLHSGVLDGPVDYAVYLPRGYDSEGPRYPTLYLLHGRGDSRETWLRVLGDLDELTAAGTVPPLIAVMPDAPWSGRAGYYVDSLFSGDDRHDGGVAIETAFAKDLVAHVDGRFGTIAAPESRLVCGYSMGGAGAVRFVTNHPRLFGWGIAMSPAVYATSPPSDSTTRSSGAFGVGSELFVDGRYRELGYPAGFAGFGSANPVHLFVGVGDDEVPRADHADAMLVCGDENGGGDEFEAEILADQARLIPGLTTEFHLVEGQHNWSVWRRLFRLGLADFARRSSSKTQHEGP